ncbi:MAG: hypothetical protein ACE5JQ_10755 [Candidatus Methylomirabilales bacterium]
MTTPGKLGLFFLILSLVSAISFAEPRPTSPQLQRPEKDSTWERLKEKDGVIIFLRERSGTAFKEAIGKGVIDAPPCRVFQVLTDSDRLVDFMPYLKGRIIKNGSGDEDYGCQYLDFPWPFSDRFIKFRTKRIQNYRNHPCEYFVYWRKDETFSCTLEEVKEAYEDAGSDPIVPRANEGYWYLVPQAGGKKTLAYYYVFTDPGGSIPSWLMNLYADDAILRVFKAVRERTGKESLYPSCQCT